MRYLMIVLCLLSLVGCSSYIDFTEEITVKSKSTDVNGTIYYLTGKFPDTYTSIKAGIDFANVGDTITFKDGVIKVVKE